MYKSAFALGAIVLCLMGSASAATAPAAPLPQVAAGGAPNIFYGGVNPAAAANSPVVVFVHGLGSNATYFFSNGNTMYQYVYNAGYRSAYVSLNADNSNDHNKIATNTTTLLGLLPQILQHFGVQQVYMFGHSEGGLEIQLAIRHGRENRQRVRLPQPRSVRPAADARGHSASRNRSRSRNGRRPVLHA
jgi:pimeloyl-ACP methyl ester carboxylesterase